MASYYRQTAPEASRGLPCPKPPETVMKGRPEAASRAGSGRRQHLLHFVDEVAQMDRLGQHLGLLGRLRIRIERHGGKAGDEHDLDVRIEFGRAAGEFDAVH